MPEASGARDVANDVNWSGLGLELTCLDWLEHIQKRINSKPGPALASGSLQFLESEKYSTIA